MPKRLSVDPQALNHAATTVIGSADEWAAAHGGSAARISSAGAGWAGQSANALGKAAAQWDSRAQLLHARIEAHGNAIRNSATAFTQADDRHRTALENLAADLPPR